MIFGKNSKPSNKQSTKKALKSLSVIYKIHSYLLAKTITTLVFYNPYYFIPIVSIVFYSFYNSYLPE